MATERSGEAVILVDLLGDELNWQCQEEYLKTLVDSNKLWSSDLKTLASPFCWRCRPTLLLVRARRREYLVNID